MNFALRGGKKQVWAGRSEVGLERSVRSACFIKSTQVEERDPFMECPFEKLDCFHNYQPRESNPPKF